MKMPKIQNPKTKGKLWDKRNHWPEGTHILKDWYPNLYWCVIDNVIMKGYDNLLLCERYIENETK